MDKVIVVGAGIAGLTAAYVLQKHGINVQVIEAASLVGGRMTTDSTNGYIIDCGAQFLSTAYPVLKDLIFELGLQDEFIATSPWAAIRRNGTIHKFRYDDLFSPVRSGLLNWHEWLKLGLGSARMASRLFNLSVNNYSDWAEFDTSYTTDWYNTRYGTWMTEYIIEPMLEGFYFQSPEETSCALPIAVSAFLARGAKTMTLKHGIGSLALALAGELNIVLNEKVDKIIVEREKVHIYTSQREIESEKVILAVPAHNAKEIFTSSSEIETALLNTSYASTINLTIGTAKEWNIPKALDGVYGLLLPRNERNHVAAVAIETAKHPERAQSGHLLNIMLDGKSGAKMIEWDDEKILQTLLPELEDIFPRISDSIVFNNLYRWKHAEPKSPVGRAKNIREYRNQISRNHRVVLAGDYMGMPFTEGAAETGLWAALAIL